MTECFETRVRASREAKKKTQQELANELGIEKQTVSGYETGHSTPPTKGLKQLANALDVSIDYLLGNDSYAAISVEGLLTDQVAAVSAIVEGFRLANSRAK